MAITIRQIPFNVDFYWKGERYKQCIRMKNPKTKSKVLCYKTHDQYSGYFEMPMGRIIKPIIRIKNER